MPSEDLFQQKYQSYFKADSLEECPLSSQVLSDVPSRASYQVSTGQARTAPPAPLLLYQRGCWKLGASTRTHGGPQAAEGTPRGLRALQCSCLEEISNGHLGTRGGAPPAVPAAVSCSDLH